MFVESVLELEQCLPEFLDGVEGPDPQQLLLQRADEPLGHAVTLWRPDEARAGFDIPRNAWLMYCGPWSWRRTRPPAMPWAGGP